MSERHDRPHPSGSSKPKEQAAAIERAAAELRFAAYTAGLDLHCVVALLQSLTRCCTAMDDQQAIVAMEGVITELVHLSRADVGAIVLVRRLEVLFSHAHVHGGADDQRAQGAMYVLSEALRAAAQDITDDVRRELGLA